MLDEAMKALEDLHKGFDEEWAKQMHHYPKEIMPVEAVKVLCRLFYTEGGCKAMDFVNKKLDQIDHAKL